MLHDCRNRIVVFDHNLQCLYIIILTGKVSSLTLCNVQNINLNKIMPNKSFFVVVFFLSQ